MNDSMYLNNKILNDYIGDHFNLTLSCSAEIDERYQFLFLRLMKELNRLSSNKAQIHVFYIDTDKKTGIPTPQVEIIGKEPAGFELLCDRYELLYKSMLSS